MQVRTRRDARKCTSEVTRLVTGLVTVLPHPRKSDLAPNSVQQGSGGRNQDKMIQGRAGRAGSQGRTDEADPLQSRAEDHHGRADGIEDLHGGADDHHSSVDGAEDLHGGVEDHQSRSGETKGLEHKAQRVLQWPQGLCPDRMSGLRPSGGLVERLIQRLLSTDLMRRIDKQSSRTASIAVIGQARDSVTASLETDRRFRTD